MISNSTTVSINNNRVKNTNNKQNQNNPKFKGFGGTIMNGAGWAMNSIENGGFVASFLIQDTLGMTVPRTREGLYRDRDKKNLKFKDMNFKEAGEVFIREFLSGPLMMFTPFIVFALTKKFIGKSTFTNTGLLKKMGKNFTEVVKNKASGESVKGLKEKFYRKSIKDMVSHTTPEASAQKTNDAVNTIYGHVSKLDSLEAKVKTAKGLSLKDKFLNIFRKKSNKVVSEKQKIQNEIANTKSNIANEFNNFHTENSNNLQYANKIKLDNETYNSENAITAMRSYASDILKNKKAEDITEQTAKQFEKTSMAKRIFSTVVASLATIGSTSIVPSLYAILNPVPPSALDNSCDNPTHKHNENVTPKVAQPQQQPANKNGNVQFKGNILKQLQFDGNQLTPMLMTTLAAGGLVAPRINTAIKRAPIDKETGKKDLIEVPEILTRDITSTVAVTCGVPILTKAMVNLYEKPTGFVLTNGSHKKTSIFKKVLDTINPLSSVGPFSNKDIKEIYGNVDNKAKLTNFAQFIDKNDGNLFKVFKRLKNGKSSFAGTVADFDAISKLDNKSANAKIMEVIANNFDDKKVKTLMEAAKSGKPNGMLKRARGLNSLPRFVNTLILVPSFLGIILPKIVYGITAKNRKKAEMAKTPKGINELETPINNTPLIIQNSKNISKSFGQTKTFDKLKQHNNK